jgi:DNA-binding NtrC family response regulator
MIQIVTKDRKMQELLALVETVASSKASVLIQGESGTGKQLIARAIHERSTRRDQPFVIVNCASLVAGTESAADAELFGAPSHHYPGGYSPGKIEQARGGSLVLDDISDMDIKLQVKLTKVLQDGQIQPASLFANLTLSGAAPIPIDVRIFSLSNKQLSPLVRLGKFREDLFYRLNVVNINLPALRDRGDDVYALAEYFLKRSAKAQGLDILPVLSESACLQLKSYNWPGNIRELENVLERAMSMHSGQVIEMLDLSNPVLANSFGLSGSLSPGVPGHGGPSFSGLSDLNGPGSFRSNLNPNQQTPLSGFGGPANGHPNMFTQGSGAFVAAGGATVSGGDLSAAQNWRPGTTLNDVERRVIIDALRFHSGNRTHTAKALGISIRTLRNKIADYRRMGIHL